MKTVLTPQDHQHIADAIAAAEATTSGEIYCVVARTVATYRWIPVTLAATVALAILPLVGLLAPDPQSWPLIGSNWRSGNVVAGDIATTLGHALYVLGLVQLGAFIVVAALTWPLRVRLWFTPKAMRRHKVWHTARNQFLAQGLQYTSARTGMMLFVALGERQAVLIADEGINAKVEQQVWEATVAELTKAAGEGHLADGLVAAVGQCGRLLAQHFPPEAQPLNQLPNRVVEL